MAITAVQSEVLNMPGVWMYLWETVPKNDPTNPIQQPGKRAVLHVKGTFGATLTFEGSNDGVTYATLKDHAGNAISATAEGIYQIEMLPAYCRIAITNAGTPDVDAYLCVFD